MPAASNLDPSNLEFTSVDVGNPTVNLIPGEVRARFNIRYNDCHSQTALKTLVEQRAQAAAAGHVNFTIEWQPSNADVFVTKPGPFTELAISAIAEVTGRKPKLSTSGGTSDARFIKDYCPVLEFGLVGQTMHAVDERAPVADLITLTAIYRRMIERYFEGPGALSRSAMICSAAATPVRESRRARSRIVATNKLRRQRTDDCRPLSASVCRQSA